MKPTYETNGIPPLPAGFVESLAPLLQEETQDFLKSYDLPFARGLRRNPLKIPEGGLAPWVEGIGDNVPWEREGSYLSLDSKAGAHPLHEAGAYYLQEPSAMAAVAAFDPKPEEWILDLCAAPGGKSTQIAARMAGRGMLVSNEPVPSRAQILASNMERMGVSNALVTCETPERLAKRWPGQFDRVLVDAPCSGEGMFRRHPETRTEWSTQAPAGCARRQSEILVQAARMVRDGGVLCYSTCTFNTVENEDVVEAFLGDHPEFTLAPFALTDDLRAQGGMLHLFPHKVQGEGHFVALMQKRGGSGEACGRAMEKPAAKLPKNDMAAYEAFCMDTFGCPGPEPTGLFAGRLVRLPAQIDICGLKVCRAGLHLGQVRGKHFVPDHAFAMSCLLPESCPFLSLTLTEAEAYLRGETLPAPDGLRGYLTVRLHGLALGWGKAADGRIQNHYPKGLRKG